MAGSQCGGDSISAKPGVAKHGKISPLFEGPLSLSYMGLTSYMLATSGFLVHMWLQYDRPSVPAFQAFLIPIKAPVVVWFSSIVCVSLSVMVVFLKRIYPPHAARRNHFAWQMISIVMLMAFTFAIIFNIPSLPGSIATIAMMLTAVEYVRLDLPIAQISTKRMLHLILAALLAIVILWFVNGIGVMLNLNTYEGWLSYCILPVMMFGLMAFVAFCVVLDNMRRYRLFAR